MSKVLTATVYLTRQVVGVDIPAVAVRHQARSEGGHSLIAEAGCCTVLDRFDSSEHTCVAPIKGSVY